MYLTCILNKVDFIDLELSFLRLLYLYHQPDRLMVFFSGCYNILENDTDIKDCFKIFLTSLTKLSNIKSYSYML